MPEITTTSEFPLSTRKALQILRDIVEMDSSRLRFSKHAKVRMESRDVTVRDVLHVIESRSAAFSERPHQTAGGSWKFNLRAFPSGVNVEVVFVISKCETDPAALVVTVMNTK